MITQIKIEQLQSESNFYFILIFNQFLNLKGSLVDPTRRVRALASQTGVPIFHTTHHTFKLKIYG